MTDTLLERRWLTPDQAAEYLGVSKATLARLVVPRSRLGHRTVRYDRRELDAYLESRKEVA